ncbi:MAG: ACP S-malonyltransferase [Actinobacteria bacterium]|nr:ACP S-malonyltransferase [Actinomycetota bacterium]
MLAFMFPGQGSQRPGMGSAWVDQPSFEIAVEASKILDRDIPRLLIDAPGDELKDTANAQIAMCVMSLIILDAIERTGLSPTWCAGHSLGEYTALVASGYMSFEEGLQVVAERGAAMQYASERHPGTMVALIGISDEEADIACRKADDDVWPANFNAPGQVAIAGSPEGIEKAIAYAKAMGARKAIELQVSGAFHTPLMLDAKDRLRKALSQVRWNASEVPVVANVDAMEHSDPDEWPSLLSAQLINPVRWHQSLRTLGTAGANALIEVGPGGVLCGMARRVLPEQKVLPAGTPRDVGNLLEEIAGNDWVSTRVDRSQGEGLSISERVVVAPTGGIFQPRTDLATRIPGPGSALPRRRDAVGANMPLGEALPSSVDSWNTAGVISTLPQRSSQRSSADHSGMDIQVGEEIGTVSGTPLRTPFEGRLIGFLVQPGERIVSGQPVAWLRAGSSPTTSAQHLRSTARSATKL